MTKIVMPNHLNSTAIKGLKQPLEAVAEILDEQGQHIYAVALREAAEVCLAFAAINLDKTAELFVL